MKKFLAAPILFFLASFVSAANAKESAFYVITNHADGNSVIGFKKNQSGDYEKMGEYPTGGRGTGDLEIPALQKDVTNPLANGDDPLISANAIAATSDRKYIVAVNPGDATISLLGVGADLGLTMSSKTPASDKFPISLAVNGDLVAVASVGADNNHGSIATYTIDGGNLIPVENSRRDLQARPSTIAFSSDGEHVIVNELVTGKVKVFSVDENNLSAEPVSMIDSPRMRDDRFQAVPVGLVVRGDGGDDVLFVSEARFLTPDFMLRKDEGKVVQSPLYSWQTGSLSTYAVRDDGMISLLSADVLTGDAIEGGEIANCWISLSQDGKYLFAANALSSSISRFSIDAQGHAFLDELTAYKDRKENLFFSDQNISHDGKELYQLVGNKGKVMIFEIDGDANLSLKQTVSGLPELGAYGMLVY